MKIIIRHLAEDEDEGNQELDDLLQFLLTLPQKWSNLMAAIDDLTAAITAEEANIAAVQTYLQTILAELAALQDGATAAQIQALTAKITTDAATLAAMVPVPTPPPTPTPTPTPAPAA